VKKPKLENGGATVPAKVDRAAGLQKTAQMVKTQQAKSPSKPLKKNEKEKKSKEEEETVAKEENDSEEEEGDFVDFGEEEDEDDKVGEEDGGRQGKKGKAAAEKKLRPYAAPTFEEIKRLKETEELFKSNLFRLQVCKPITLSWRRAATSPPNALADGRRVLCVRSSCGRLPSCCLR
jgi:hypothetical protein